MKREYNTHHLLPRSKGGITVHSNITEMDIRKHQALHMLFDNRTPKEQLEKLLAINKSCMSTEVIIDLQKIFYVSDMDYWYKREIYKRK